MSYARNVKLHSASKVRLYSLATGIFIEALVRPVAVSEDLFDLFASLFTQVNFAIEVRNLFALADAGLTYALYLLIRVAQTFE
jgi:hypothetical protein